MTTTTTTQPDVFAQKLEAIRDMATHCLEVNSEFPDADPSVGACAILAQVESLLKHVGMPSYWAMVSRAPSGLDQIQQSLDALREATVAELSAVQDPTVKRKVRTAAAKRLSDAEVNLIRTTQSVLSDWAVPLDDIDGSSYVQRTCDAFQNVQY